MTRFRAIALGIAMLAAATAAGAQTAPPPDPAFEAAKIAFEALPESDRKAIQEALVWTGLYNGTTAGGFGRRTYDAIAAFQKQAGAKPDGVLDARSRAALNQAAARARDAIGFKPVTDARTKLRIGIPQKILTKTEAVAATGGTRWQSGDGKITLDTRAYPAAESDLPQLFERLTAQANPNRKVTYKLLRPDFLVVSGETPTGKFFIRYGAGADGLRGFTLGYDKSLAANFDKVVIAITNSFEPYPDAETNVAAAPAVPPPAPRVSPSRGAGTALMIDARRALTAASLACETPLVGGVRARIVESDKAAGLALLELERAAAAPASLALAAPGEGASVVVLEQGIAAGPPALTVAPGEITASGRVSAALQPGAAGAPVFDRSGALLGLVTAYPEAPRQVAGIVPPASYPLSDPAALGRLLEKAGVAAGVAPTSAQRSAGEIAALRGAATVAVACTR